MQKKLEDLRLEHQQTKKQLNETKKTLESTSAKFKAFESYARELTSSQKKQMDDLVKRHNGERSTLLNQIATLQGKKVPADTSTLQAELLQKDAQIKALNDQLKARYT